MWAPVPPLIEYTITPPSALPDRGLVRANIAAVSSSSSSPSTRVMPNCRNTALVTASDPVRCPVCAMAIERPSSVRPTLTHVTGTPARAATSAASIKVRPSLKPSM